MTWVCKEHGKESFCVGNYIANLLNREITNLNCFTESDLNDEKDLKKLTELVEWVEK